MYEQASDPGSVLESRTACGGQSRRDSVGRAELQAEPPLPSARASEAREFRH